jgi:hypothetical protein
MFLVVAMVLDVNLKGAQLSVLKEFDLSDVF